MNSWTFRLLDAAENDANEAFDWYQTQRPGLGVEFRIELKLAIGRIVSNPSQYAVIYGSDVRRAHLHRFPYSIIYQVSENSVVVLAIFHYSRNPIIWRGRID